MSRLSQPFLRNPTSKKLEEDIALLKFASDLSHHSRLHRKLRGHLPILLNRSGVSIATKIDGSVSGYWSEVTTPVWSGYILFHYYVEPTYQFLHIFLVHTRQIQCISTPPLMSIPEFYQRLCNVLITVLCNILIIFYSSKILFLHTLICQINYLHYYLNKTGITVTI